MANVLVGPLSLGISLSVRMLGEELGEEIYNSRISVEENELGRQNY